MTNFSVLTNPQAASAVLNLNKTLTNLNISQERINTGFKVGSAKDDASTFAIALGMRSDVAGFRAVRENLALGKSTLGVASAAANQIAEELKAIKSKVTQAANQGTGRDLIQISIENARDQIKAITAAAQFNGVNLIDGSRRGETFDVVSSLDRDPAGKLNLSTIDVSYQDLSIEEVNRGLGAIRDLDVTEGKATETVTERSDPVSATVTLGAATDASITAAGTTQVDNEIQFNYIDADGEAQTLTFTVVAGATTNPFEIGSADDDVGALAVDLAAKLTAQTQDGGALAGLGFTFATDGTGVTDSTEVTVTRDLAKSPGEIAGFATATGATEYDQAGADFLLSEARPGVAQIELGFNKKLEAGDTIDITLNNGTNTSTFTLVVGEKNESGTNGALIAGSANKYFLDYADVVGNDTTDKTQAEVATLVASVLNDTTSGISDAMALHVGATEFAGDATPANNAFLVQAVNNQVVITDRNQAAADADQLVSFNMANAPGGSLDFDLMLAQVDEAEAVLKQVVGELGATEQRIDSQTTFMDELVKSINDGIGTLVDANMAEESAKFQALQVQQQLRETYQRMAHIEDEERRRIASDIHDQLGQKLSLLSIYFNLMKTDINPKQNSRLNQQLQQSEKLVESISTQLRDIIGDLYPAMLETWGLAYTLREFANRLSANLPLKVEINCFVPSDVPSRIQLQLLRIVQEGVTNIIKHAEASEAQVDLLILTDTLHMTIRDNGIGYSSLPTAEDRVAHRGLSIIQDRAASIGGTMSIRVHPEGGTELAIRSNQLMN